jgi:hypothetical protein
MAAVIARERKEMKDRLRKVEAELATVEALVAEKARLERALAAPPFADAPPAPARKPRAPRALRGANRAAVYAAMETMPGASVGGSPRPRASDANRPTRCCAPASRRANKTVELAAGQMGYRIAAQPETSFPAPPVGEPGVAVRLAAAEDHAVTEPTAPAADATRESATSGAADVT